MAIEFLNKVSYSPPSGHITIAATADDTNIYLHTTDTSSEAKIATYTPAGVKRSEVDILYTDNNAGLTAVGNGFAYLTANRLLQWQIKLVASDGSLTQSYDITIAGNVISDAYNLDYDPTTRNYRIFYRLRSGSQASRVRSSVLSTQSGLVSSIVLSEGFGSGSAGLTRADDVWYQAPLSSSRSLVITDSNLVITSETLGVGEVTSSIDALAWHDNKLVVITSDEMFFFGEPATPVVKKTPTQQLFLPSKYYERFDVVSTQVTTPVTGSAISAVKAKNTQMIHQTEIKSIQIYYNQPQVKRVNDEMFVPKFTVPTVAVGDVIQRNTTGETDPTTIGQDFWTIDRLREVGDNQRQAFITELDT